jgi:hypothetical protein
LTAVAQAGERRQGFLAPCAVAATASYRTGRVKARAVSDKDAMMNYRDAIAVKNLHQECDYMARQACDCGGSYISIRRYAIDDGTAKKYGQWQTECDTCGQPEEFLFDVSAGPSRSPGGYRRPEA